MDKPTGTCPGCLGSFRLTEGRGAMKRHGFSAHFPHGRAGMGFHTGSCPGTSVRPIGTVEGNRFAVRLAKSYRDSARRLSDLPQTTLDEAAEAAVYECRSYLARRSGYGEALRDGFKKPEDFADSSMRDWFTEDRLRNRMKAMDKKRADHIENLRRSADALAAAVSAARSGALDK